MVPLTRSSLVRGVPIKLLTYEGTEEEAQRAKELVIRVTNTPWPFEDESSDDEDETIQYLEPPIAMTRMEMEYYADTTTDLGLDSFAKAQDKEDSRASQAITRHLSG
jgi:hypothetical protein